MGDPHPADLATATAQRDRLREHREQLVDRRDAREVRRNAIRQRITSLQRFIRDHPAPKP
jgi:hypothetical protein